MQNAEEKSIFVRLLYLTGQDVQLKFQNSYIAGRLNKYEPTDNALWAVESENGIEIRFLEENVSEVHNNPNIITITDEKLEP